MLSFSDLKGLFELILKWPAPELAAVAICLLIAWAAWAHEIGFAKQVEVEAIKLELTSLQQEVKSAREETLEGQLFDAKMLLCKSDGELRKAYALRIATLQARYRELTGGDYSLFLCSEL